MSENCRILSVVVVLFVGFAIPTAAAADSIGPVPIAASSQRALAPTQHELAILRAVNDVRSANGRRPLVLGPRLQRAARSHSVDMVRRGYFDHGPFVQRLRRFGVRSRVIGENLAYATQEGYTPAAVLHMWLTSPSHRSVLLDRSFRRIGIGVAGGTARLVTADFAG